MDVDISHGMSTIERESCEKEESRSSIMAGMKTAIKIK